MPLATIAVVVDPDSGSPWSSTRNTRSASPSKARPTSAPVSTHPGLEVAQVLGLDRVGRVVREGAVELAVHDLEVERQRRRTPAGTTSPPMPLAVSATTFSGRQRRRRRRSERTWSAKSPSRSIARGDRRSRRRGRHALGAPGRLISAEPGVLADRAGARQAHLDAVVLGRVVRRREHGARGVERAGGEVHRGRSRPARGRRRRGPGAARPRRRPRPARRPLGRMSRADEHPVGAVGLGRRSGRRRRRCARPDRRRAGRGRCRGCRRP